MTLPQSSQPVLERRSTVADARSALPPDWPGPVGPPGSGSTRGGLGSASTDCSFSRWTTDEPLNSSAHTSNAFTSHPPNQIFEGQGFHGLQDPRGWIPPHEPLPEPVTQRVHPQFHAAGLSGHEYHPLPRDFTQTWQSPADLAATDPSYYRGRGGEFEDEARSNLGVIPSTSGIAQSMPNLGPLTSSEDSRLAYENPGVARREHPAVRPAMPYPPLNGRHVPHHTKRSSTQLPAVAQLPTELRTSVGLTSAPLTPENPSWRLTPEVFQWLFAVLYPKRRTDKTRPTPSGPCLLCDSVCKRSGILQQHIIIIHRLRIARKIHMHQSYNHELALAFVVAQLRSVGDRDRTTMLEAECNAFLKMLEERKGFGTPQPLAPNAFPVLEQSLITASQHESWIGVQCQQCGMWATRPIALEEHAIVCVQTRRSDQSSLSPIS